MGLPYGIQGGGNLTLNESKIILEKAYSSGVRCLDTAEVYGKAHQVVGDFHRTSDFQLSVMTKLPKVLDRKIGNKIDQYLEELRVKELEALMFHSFEAFKENLKVLGELKDLKKSGVVRNIGVSLYTNEELEIVLKNKHIDIIQLPFNLLDNFSLRGELLKKAKENDKIIHTRSAFLQGLFFMDVGSKHRVVKELRPSLVQLQLIAKEENRGMASLALNYCLQQELIDKVLIGVDSIDQLNQNLSLTENPLSEESVEKINNIIVRNRNLLNPSTWN